MLVLPHPMLAPNISEIVAFGCDAATTCSSPGAPALWPGQFVDLGDIAKPDLDQPERLKTMNFTANATSTEGSQMGSKRSSNVSLFSVGAKQWDHKGEQSQAPRQALGVVTLHAICDE